MNILAEHHVITDLPTLGPSPASLPFFIEDKGCEVTATRPVSHPVITPDAVGVNSPFDASERNDWQFWQREERDSGRHIAIHPEFTLDRIGHNAGR